MVDADAVAIDMMAIHKSTCSTETSVRARSPLFRSVLASKGVPTASHACVCVFVRLFLVRVCVFSGAPRREKSRTTETRAALLAHRCS